MARINAYLPGNGVHDYIIITGKYLNLDTIFAQLADSLGRRGLGGIKKRQVTNKYHLVLVGDGKVPCLADKAFLCDGKYPHPVTIHIITDSLCLTSEFIGQFIYLTVELGMRANIQHLLHSSLRDDLPFSLLIFNNYRHPTSTEIKRYLIYLRVTFRQMFQIFFAYVGKDSFVHQVLETCLKVTVKECVAQYPSGMIIAAIRIDILLQYDFIAGQRTGLVGTKNVHGPEVLDGIEILHDRFFLRH